MNTPNNENRKKDKLKIIRIALGILLILLSLLAAVLLIFKGCTGKEPGDPNSGFVLDDRAVEGGWNEADVSKIQEGLNAGVEEGYINISMNTTPVFADGKSEGNLMIVNQDLCVKCGICAKVCPQKCIKTGEKYVVMEKSA